MDVVDIGHEAISTWWIGLEDRDGDGQFMWQDGTDVTYLDWSKHEPAQIATTSKCVMMTSQV